MVESFDSAHRLVRPPARAIVAYVVISLVAGAITSSAINSTITRSWRDCGVAGAGEGMTLLLLLVPNVIAAALWWGATLTISRRFRDRAPAVIRGALTFLVCLLGSLGLLWFTMFWLHDPGQSARIPICPPGNIPPWWPAWLPI
ncbi:hypothetical protein ACFWM1_04710 [Nocardia sp. NPDC058379]|uniref:hypothetical protein n=1 Tax=unclassified Nocardia TaxID=2637762 RepID=UPI0036566584